MASAFAPRRTEKPRASSAAASSSSDPAKLTLITDVPPIAVLVTPTPRTPPVPRTVLVNPVITPLPNPVDGNLLEVSDWEGCLSVPGLRAIVPRFERIRYTGFDPFGDPIDRTVDGFHARVVQHECDHLLGMLYPMRVRDFSRFGFTSVLFPGLDAPEDD